MNRNDTFSTYTGLEFCLCLWVIIVVMVTSVKHLLKRYIPSVQCRIANTRFLKIWALNHFVKFNALRVVSHLLPC